MDKKSLIKQLNEKYATAKFQARVAYDARKEIEPMIQTQSLLNPKYISAKQYFIIVQFYLFLKQNPDLSDDEIRDLIYSKNKCSFLKEVDKYVPDFFKDLKCNGYHYVAILYIETKYNVSSKIASETNY